MPTVVKINANNEVEELENWKADKDYINNVLDGYALLVSEVWEHKKYKLTVFMLDIMEEKDECNGLATHLFKSLKSPFGPVNDTVSGFMFILNEDEKRQINFTTTDLNYILEKSKSIQYQDRREREMKFLRFLNALEDE